MKPLLYGALALLAIACTAWSSVSGEPILAGVSYGGLVTSSEGRILRLGLAPDDKYRLFVELDDIAPAAVKATLLYEDRHFFSHPGVNPVSLLRGLMSLFGGRRIGGSTITMQVARLRYGLATSTLPGKLRQIFMALGLELRHSKQEILAAYFNLAPYGGNVEGIEAASRIYFHKAAVQLTGSEALALAIVPQNPCARHPVTGKDFDNARLRAQTAGILGAVKATERLKVFAMRDIPFLAPHFSSQALANNPGVLSQTTLSIDLQAMLERCISNYAAIGSAYGLNNAAAMLVNLDTMGISALAGSADFFSSAIQGQIDGTRARRSPGSTLKPFVYALAVEQGLIHPQTILADTPRSFGGYDPENFDHGFKGPVPAAEALRASRNLPAITLAEKLAAPGLYGFLRNADIKFDNGPDYYGLALVLGGAEISMRDLAALYAMLANHGQWQPLRYLKDEDRGAPRRLLSPEAAWLVLHMLRNSETEIMSFGRTFPIFYKTGTSNGLRDAWTAGIVGQYVLVVWAGNFDNSSNSALVGAQAALPLFEEIASNLGMMRRLEALVPELPNSLNIEKEKFCRSTGDPYRGQCEEFVENWFIPGVSPMADTGILRKVLIDSVTGLRDCESDPDRTQTIWMEFWPTDLARIFASAGVYKPSPPEWKPGCEGKGASLSKSPRILLPKKNVVYHRFLGDESFRLPLMAVSDRDAGQIYWFAGETYLGSTIPGEVLYWNAPAGNTQIVAIDDNGRETRQICKIESASQSQMN